MAIINNNGIDGKVCSTCRMWKPLIEFSPDPTHRASQGGRHCRCKECHRRLARIRRNARRNEQRPYLTYLND